MKIFTIVFKIKLKMCTRECTSSIKRITVIQKIIYRERLLTFLNCGECDRNIAFNLIVAVGILE